MNGIENLKKGIIIFLKSTGIKMNSLFLAIGIWFLIHTKVEEENMGIKVYDNVPIIFINQPIDLNILESSLELYRG